METPTGSKVAAARSKAERVDPLEQNSSHALFTTIWEPFCASAVDHGVIPFAYPQRGAPRLKNKALQTKRYLEPFSYD